MALMHQEGVANNLVSWFVLFETWVQTTGWVVVSGSGTTNLVLSSTGEDGTKTKLFARIYEVAGNINAQVMDDAVGTHSTTEASVLYASSSISFYYAFSGDKDYLLLHTLSGTSRQSIYVGLLCPFGITIPDETYLMVKVSFNYTPTTDTARLLRNSVGAWDQISSINSNARFLASMNTYYPDKYISLHPTVVGSGVNLIGTLKNVCKTDHRKGISNDLLDTTINGATSRWLKNGWVAWLISGNIPQIIEEPSTFFSANLSTSNLTTVFDTLIVPTLITVGWIITDNSGISGFFRDIYADSVGEDGQSDIHLRFYRQTNASDIMAMCYDITRANSTTAYVLITNYASVYTHYICVDKDCLIYFNASSATNAKWIGKLIPIAIPDARTPYTDYLVGMLRAAVGPGNFYRLRDVYSGAWAPAGINSNFDDMDGTWSTNSSLNNLGNNAVLFPLIPYTTRFSGAGGVNNIMVGWLRHFYRVSGTVANGDTITIGAKVYTVDSVTGPKYFAIRTT